MNRRDPKLTALQFNEYFNPVFPFRGIIVSVEILWGHPASHERLMLLWQLEQSWPFRYNIIM